MRPFAFRLETLMRVRENRRDQHRIRLAEAVERDETLAQRQAELERQRQTLQDQCREAAAPGELDLERLIGFRRYDRLVAVEQCKLESQRTQTAHRVERRRAALVAAERDLRSLERLEAKQQAGHLEQQQRHEINVLDEMAAGGHGR